MIVLWLVIPFLIVVPWVPIPQAPQLLFFSWFAVIALLCFWISKKNFQASYAELWIWAALCWSIVRMEPRREWNAELLCQLFCIASVLLICREFKFQKNIFPFILFAWILVNCLFLGGEKIQAWLYLHTPFNQKNHFEWLNYFVSSLLIYSWSFRTEKKRWVSVAVIVLAVIASFTMIHLQAKGMLLSLLGAGIAFPILIWFRFNCKLPKWIFGATLIVVLALVGLAVPYFAAMHSALSLGDSFSSRQTFWRATFNLIHAHWALGVGSFSYQGWIREFWPSVLDAQFLTTLYPSVAHSRLLNFWAENGLIGLGLQMVIMAQAVWFSAQRAQRKREILFTALLCGGWIASALMEVDQLFFSAILLFYVVNAIALRGAYSIDVQPRVRNLIFGLVLLGLIYSSVGYYRQLQAMHLVREIANQHVVQGGADRDLLQQSMAIEPNSTSSYYAALLFMNAGMFRESEMLISTTESLSAHRWPLERLRGELYARQGLCSDAEREVEKDLRYRTIEEDAWIRNLSQWCSFRFVHRDALP